MRYVRVRQIFDVFFVSWNLKNVCLPVTQKTTYLFITHLIFDQNVKFCEKSESHPFLTMFGLLRLCIWLFLTPSFCLHPVVGRKKRWKFRFRGKAAQFYRTAMTIFTSFFFFQLNCSTSFIFSLCAVCSKTILFVWRVCTDFYFVLVSVVSIVQILPFFEIERNLLIGVLKLCFVGFWGAQVERPCTRVSSLSWKTLTRTAKQWVWRRGGSTKNFASHQCCSRPAPHCCSKASAVLLLDLLTRHDRCVCADEACLFLVRIRTDLSEPRKNKGPVETDKNINWGKRSRRGILEKSPWFNNLDKLCWWFSFVAYFTPPPQSIVQCNVKRICWNQALLCSYHSLHLCGREEERLREQTRHVLWISSLEDLVVYISFMSPKFPHKSWHNSLSVIKTLVDQLDEKSMKQVRNFHFCFRTFSLVSELKKKKLAALWLLFSPEKVQNDCHCWGRSNASGWISWQIRSVLDHMTAVKSHDSVAPRPQNTSATFTCWQLSAEVWNSSRIHGHRGVESEVHLCETPNANHSENR